MFDNIGEKIKRLAEVSFLVGVGLFLIGGIILISLELYWIGVVALTVGPIISWVSSWFTYGFGELITNSSIIAGREGVTVAPAPVSNANSTAPVTPVAHSANAVTAAPAVSKPAPATPARQDNKSTETISKCDFCGAENVTGAYCKLVDDMGVRYRNLCNNCIEEYKKAKESGNIKDHQRV